MNFRQAWQGFKAWTGRHRDIALDLIRVFLGIALLVRGALLLDNPAAFGEYASRVHWFVPYALAHYVGIAHLSGGFLLAIGLVTRLSAGVQLPALFGAVFLVHMREGLLAEGQSLELSALVLFSLLVITVFGAGRLSLDHYIFGERKAPATEDEAAAYPPSVGEPAAATR
ncbi:MAG: DoxX family protein [Polyangiaceae bacterium]|nr:DoxX family protein [Polyangiaceae bacterium]